MSKAARLTSSTWLWSILLVVSIACAKHPAVAKVVLMATGADDTALLQTTVNSLQNGDELELQGFFKVSNTITATHKAAIWILCAGNGSGINWLGANKPVLRFLGLRDSTLSNCLIQSNPSFPVTTAVVFETSAGFTNTNNAVEHVHINGTATGGLQKGFATIAGDGGDNNNDLMTFMQTHVENYTIAAYSFEHSQSAGHTLFKARFDGNQIGQYGVSTALGAGYGGSFRCLECTGGGNTQADFYLGAPVQTIAVSGTFESSNRFLQTASTNGAAWPVTLENVRVSLDRLNADNHVIIYNSPGPLIIRGCLIGGGEGRAADIYVAPISSVVRIVYEGNFIYSTRPNIFSLLQPAAVLGNLIDRNDGQGTALYPNSIATP